MTSTERGQKVRESRRKQGLCTRCGHVAVSLMRWCALCREFNNERRRNNAKLKLQVRQAMRRQNVRRRAAGLCVSCRVPSATYRCAVCAALGAERNKAHRERKREAGLCVDCDQPSPRHRCSGCSAVANVRNAASEARRARKKPKPSPSPAASHPCAQTCPSHPAAEA